VIGEEGATIFV